MKFITLILLLSLVISVLSENTKTTYGKKERDPRFNSLKKAGDKTLELTKHTYENIQVPPEARHSLARMWDFFPQLQSYITTTTYSQWADDYFAYTAITKVNGNTATMTFNLKRKSFGTVTYCFQTLRGLHLHEFIFDGTHTIEYTDLAADEVEEIGLVGIRAYLVKGAIDDIESLGEVIWFFINSARLPIIPPYTIEECEEFLEEYMNITFTPRNPPKPFLFTEDQLRPGDIMATLRMDGLEPSILWLAGGMAGHMAIIWLDDKGNKVICDSTRDGLVCYPWQTWVNEFQSEHYSIAYMPLAPQYRALLNISAGWDWYTTVAGLPYGHDNLLFTSFDTETLNMPPLLLHFIEFYGAFVSRFIPAEMNLIAPALCHRLNIPLNSDWPTILLQSEKQFGSVNKAAAIPEQDDWLYDGHLSRVCSCFVIDILRAAGIFDPSINFHTTEFGTKDVVDIALYDTNWVDMPQICKDSDPEIAALGYCQVMGTFKYVLQDTYNTVQPYSHMDEHCPSYYRIDGC